jgi:hypothetical protein
MKKHIIYSLVIALACIFSTGCGQQSGSRSSTTSDSEDKDMRSFKLADGTEVSCWVSNDNHAGKRSWIWCDAQTGPVSYRINRGDWKPMSKISVSDDEKLTITQDPNGKFGAAETLPQGSYTVGFKIGTQEFSGITLLVE